MLNTLENSPENVTAVSSHTEVASYPEQTDKVEIPPITSEEKDEMDVQTETENDEDSEEESIPPTQTQQILHYTDEQVEDLRKDFEANLKNLPYIDLYTEHSKLIQGRQELQQIYEDVKDTVHLSNDEWSGLVNAMDAAERKEFQGSVEEFKKNYPTHFTASSLAIDFLHKMLDYYEPSKVLSTTFISKSMVESGENRLAALEAMVVRPMNYTILKKRLQATIKAYSDRTRFDMLFNKLRYPANTLEAFKEFRKIGPQAALNYINSIFDKVFNDHNMTRFRTSIVKYAFLPNMDGANEDMVSVMTFFMTFWLAKVYEREYTSGKCAEVKTFIMNVYDSDPSSNIYDLTGGKQYFYDLAYSLFAIITAATSEEYTAKNITKKLAPMVDSMVAVCNNEFEKAAKAHPCKLIEGDTSFNHNYPDATFDDIYEKMDHFVATDNMEIEEVHFDEDDEEMEENDMNLKNQGNTDQFSNLGNTSVDESIMPEELDNRDAEETTTAGGCADGVCDILGVTPEKETPITPTTVAN